MNNQMNPNQMNSNQMNPNQMNANQMNSNSMNPNQMSQLLGRINPTGMNTHQVGSMPNQMGQMNQMTPTPAGGMSGPQPQIGPNILPNQNIGAMNQPNLAQNQMNPSGLFLSILI